MTLRLLALNIANPSPTRARRQVAWLRERPEDVLVLSETKNSKGCAQLLVGLQDAGWIVVASAPGGDGYGVAVASRVTLRRDDDPLTSGPRSADLGGRALSVLLALHPATSRKSGPDSVRLVAAYGPTSPPQGVRQRSDRTARKQAWLTAFSAALSDLADQPLVVAGDLNVVDRAHWPHYRCFTEAEYAFMDSLESRHHLVDAYRHGLAHDTLHRTGTAGCTTTATATATTMSSSQTSRAAGYAAAATCTRRDWASLGPLGDVRRARAAPGPRG